MGNKKFRPHWFFILILSLTSVIFGARTVTAQVVINEVYGGGGNIGAPYSNDFVELFNPSGSAVALTLSSVQYQSPGSNTWSVVGTLALATVPANGYYLIQLGSGGANGSALPTPDLTGSATNLNSSAGKVVLVGQVAALANGCPGAYLDLVGYGTTSAPCNEGAQNAPVPGNTTSIQRVVDGFDSNENSDDFTNLTPTPRNSTLTPPAITDIADQTIAVNGTTGALNFTVGDATTPAASLTVAGVSDNQTLAPDANIVFGGAGASRTIAVTPAAGQSGSVTITVTVTDGDNLIASDTFTLFVGSPTQCLAGGEVSVTPDTPATSGGVTLHASAQTAAQASVDAQDDAWRAGASALGLSTFGTASGLTASNKSAQQTLTDGVRSYAISTREMTNGLNAPPCNGVNLSAGRNVASNNVSLQANGPRPTAAAIGNTVYSYSETLGGLNANSGARNGLLFSFDSTQAAFGAWFGDVEGRGDSTPITVRLFDANGDRIGGDFVINETAAPYGNAATRWMVKLTV